MGPKLRSHLRATEEPSSSPLTHSKCQQLDTMCENWISLLTEELPKDLRNKFNQLIEIRKQNIEMESKINANIKHSVNQMTADMDMNCDSVQECESMLKVAHNKAFNHCHSLNQVLAKRKLFKTKVTQKLKKVSKTLDQLKNESKQLSNDFNEKQEVQTLANIMKVRYRVNNSCQSLSFDFEDRKRNQKLITCDSEDIAQEFWGFIMTQCVNTSQEFFSPLFQSEVLDNV